MRFGQTFAMPGSVREQADVAARDDEREAVRDEAVAPATRAVGIAPIRMLACARLRRGESRLVARRGEPR